MRVVGELEAEVMVQPCCFSRAERESAMFVVSWAGIRGGSGRAYL